MGKRITLIANIQVVPYENRLPDGTTEEGKQLIFSDFESGEITLYPMAKELADTVKRKLTMSNKALQASLEEEARREQARSVLGGGGAAAPMPSDAKKVVSDILKGVHHKDGEK